MKRLLLTCSLALLAVTPASACDLFGIFRCRPRVVCQPCYQQPAPMPQHRVVYYSPSGYIQPVTATQPTVPTIQYPRIVLPCPSGRCPNVR